MIPSMADATPSRVGILAGGGSLPREVAESVIARGGYAHLVAIAGESTENLDDLPHSVVRWGEVGRITSELRRAGCRHLVIIGSARRPDLGRLKPDLGFFLALPAVLRSIASGGDDILLRGVIGHFEKQGVRVIGPAEVAPELLVGQGVLGHVAPTRENEADIRLGFDIVHRLGPFDIGQGVVISGGRILAIEGAEGTDSMLARVAERRDVAPCTGGARHGVFVKRPKPGQELRVDLPAIGPETVSRVAAAGLAGIAVLAGRTLAACRGELVLRADNTRIFVVGAKPAEPREEHPLPIASKPTPRLARFGHVTPRARDHEEAARGAGITRALEPWDVGRCVVVIRRHVLAVETGEPAASTILRAGSLRQWGRSRRRNGVAVMASGREIDNALIEAAVTARLAGIAFMGAPPPASVTLAANRSRLFIAAIEPTGCAT